MLYSPGPKASEASRPQELFRFSIFDFLSFAQQFRYKSRVYRQPNVDEKQIAKLHTKVRS